MSVLAQWGADFTMNSDKGCSPFTVQVTDLSGAPDSIAINYDWGDGSPLDSGSIHTYNQAGTYTIIQTVANGSPRQHMENLEVVDAQDPDFRVFNCKGTRGSVYVRDNYYAEYYVDWGDGNTEVIPGKTLTAHDFGVISNFNITVKGLIKAGQSQTDSSNLNCSETVKTLNIVDDITTGTIQKISVTNVDKTNGSIEVAYTLDPATSYFLEIRPQGTSNFSVVDTLDLSVNSNSYIINGLNTTDNYYCFRLVAFDPCDNATLNSNEACSVQLAVNAGNNQNDLTWQTETMDFQQYFVYKDNNQLLTINNMSQKAYSDQDIFCGTQYCYNVVMNENGGLESVSGVVCVTASSSTSPPGIQDINASVSGEDIELSWNTPSTATDDSYLISRSKDQVVYSAIDSTLGNSYLDENLYVNTTRFYYHIRYIDACQNISEIGVTASPILLIRNVDESLSWSDYLGWSGGVSEYLLEKYDQDGNLLETIPMGLTRTYTEKNDVNPQQKFIYRVAAKPNDINLNEVYSNFVEIIFKSRAFFPNAFTPNGDGLNDIFNFDSNYVQAVNLFIYNRWGALIYHTDSPEKGWDGRVNGQPAPTGTYIYRAELIDEMGVTFIKTGQVVLLR